MEELIAGNCVVLVNRGSGTVRSMGEAAVKAAIAEGFGTDAAQNPILFLGGGEIEGVVRKFLAAGNVRRIIVGGGDGTVAGVAALLAGTSTALGILPLGTMNMMAKSIGMPPELAQAVTALREAEVRDIDAARAGGRLFLHHVSFGIQPRMVRIREKLGYSSRLTKMMTGLRALLAVLLKPQSQRLTLDIDGRDVALKTPALVVSNNIYDDSAWLKQARLDQGVLGIYAVRPMSLPAFIHLAFDLLRGRWRANLNVREERGLRVTIRKRRRFGGRSRNIQATIDGEIALLPLPVTITSEPGVVKMLTPRQPDR